MDTGYDGAVARIVLTVIGDDRTGLVEALSEIIAEHAGNWERGQLAELAGKFAGIVVVSMPTEGIEGLVAALRSLDGLLDVAVHRGEQEVDTSQPGEELVIDLLGTDRPGIVREVAAVLQRHELSIQVIETSTREAPMAGGQLFEAHVVVRLPTGADPLAIRADLERLAAELVVDISVGP